MKELFPSWFDMVRFEEVLLFTCGLMEDASPLVDKIYQTFVDVRIGILRMLNPKKFDQWQTRLKRLGKELGNTDASRLLYSESVVPLAGFPLNNHYLNWFDHNDDDEKEIPRNLSNLVIPSKLFEFRNIRENLHDLEIPTRHEEAKVKCSMLIENPNSEATKKLLSICCNISQVQEIVDLWLQDIEFEDDVYHTGLSLSSHAQSFTITNCKLPENMTVSLLTQLVNCRQISLIKVDEIILGEFAHLFANAVTSWGCNPPLQYFSLNNCSIPEESSCKILKFLSTCQHIKNLSLNGNHIGTYGKHLADAINNWGDVPSLQALYLNNCSIPEDSCSEILKSLATCQHITRLGLDGNQIGASGKHLAEAINNWEDVPSLQALYLRNCSIPEDSCSEILKSLATCQHITGLGLDGNYIGASGKHLAEAINNWGDVPSLQALYLNNCSIPEDSCSEILKSLATCQHITRLGLDGNQIGTSGKHLADATNNWGDVPLLEILSLDNCSILEDMCCEILKSLATCQHITDLSLDGNQIGTSGKHLAEAINNWGDVPSLQALYLNNCSIPEDSCSEILKSLATCQHITELSLARNHIGASGKHLAEAINNWGDVPSLQALYLSNCSIPEDSCSEILKSLATCQHITDLSLDGNQIGTSGKHLAEAINNWGDVPSLQALYLNNCSIPEDSCSEILKSLATCQHITRLGLDGNQIGTSGKHLADAINNWGDVPSLQALYLSNCSIPEDSCSEILKSLATCQHITRLGLDGNYIGASGKQLAEAINNWGDVPSLQALYLRNCSIPEDSCSEILKSLATCQHITRLGLDGNYIGASGKHLAEAINNWGDVPSLQALYLNNCSIPEDSCSEILKSLATCQHITRLGLDGNQIGTSGKHLADAINNWGDVPLLEILSLDNCSILEDMCCEILKSLATCQHITDLSFDGNQIGTSGKHLAEAINNWGDVPSLQALYLNNCSIPEDSCSEILKSLATCQHITRLGLDGNYIGASGKHLAEAINNWGDVPSLQAISLENCSIPEDSCSEILKSLATCQHITELSLARNHIGVSGKHLAEAINNWGDVPSLQALYLSNCSIPEDSCSEILKSLATCQHITRLGLDGNQIGTSGKHLAEAINNWGDVPSLQALYLSNCSIPEDSCSEILKSLATCQHITELSLARNHIGVSGKHLAEAINNWGDVPSLQALYLSNCSIPEDSCSEILKSLATCQHITRLGLDGNQIGTSGKHLAEAINNWGDVPSLQALYLRNCSIPEDSCSEILKSLATCQHITELSLARNHIGVSGKHLAEAINNWGDVPSLQALYLSNCSIPEDSCSEILKSLATCQHITELSLDGNQIGTSGKQLAEAINNWGDVPSLQALYLNNCSIPEDSCSEILKSLATCQHITRLGLDGNQIGTSGKHLADAINNWGDVPSLQALYLNNCSIPEDSCSEILKSLATCQHITRLGLDGNYIGASGKHLAEAINNWGDVPSLQALYLRNCSIPEDSCSEILKSLATCQHITDLSLDGNQICTSGKHLAEAINNWGDVPSLQALYLRNCSIPEDSCSEILKSLATCQHITDLSLDGNQIGTSGKHLAEAINNWGDVPSLQALYLNNCSIPEDSCSEILKSLATCQHITDLSLDGNQIGTSGKHLAEAINKWGDVPSLQALYLNNCSILEDMCCEILKSLATCQHITDLSLDGNQIGTSGKHLAEAINNWGDVPSLQALYLNNCSIPEDSCNEILKSLATCQHITRLGLDGNYIGASGKHLAEAINNWGDVPSLQAISLENCSIPEDSCSEILKSLATCQHITELSLARNHIGVSGKHLAEAINNWGDVPSLQALYLSNCSIPEDSCSEILKSLATCQHITRLGLD